MGDALEDRIEAAIQARAALEPLALIWVDNGSPPEIATQIAAQVSSAISLKRIADLLSANLGDDARNDYGETPFEAIGAGISRALRGTTR